MSTRYRFVPWVRQGAGTAVRTVDTLGAGVPGRPALPVAVRVNGRVDVTVALRLYGPGDVTGLDPRVVARTDPPHLSTGFEPNHFPSVELDRPDLPWLLTPATGDRQGRLRPWLCLVVVRRQSGVRLEPARGRPLPVLTIEAPARPADELPDLAESWAWAHAQALSADDRPLPQLLTDEASRPRSRLVCPRRLAPSTSYLACLVPAFAAGRRAGLGESAPASENEPLAPAWELARVPATLELPVFFHWEFTTGTAGDFEVLARRLRGVPPPAGFGRRPVHVGNAGFGLPDGGALPLEGALRVPGQAAGPAVAPAFREALRALLNAPDARRDTAADEPLVAPPVYGGWQAAERRVDDATRAWVRELNLDPRWRVAAGLGTMVVQDQQEQLMASAWEQLGAPGQEPRRVHQLALAHTVLARVHARLATMSAERFLEVTGPVQARVLLARPGDLFSNQPPDTPPRTVREQIRRTLVPVALTSATFRRITRPGGPLLRRAVSAAGPAGRPLAFTAHLVQAATRPRLRPLALALGTTVSPAAIDERVRSLVVLSTELARASAFSAAVRETTAYFAAAIGVPAGPGRPTLPLAALQRAMLTQLEPARTLPSAGAPAAPAGATALGATVAGAAALDDGATGEPAAPLPGPAFPQPMYAALRDLAPDLLVPGLERIPPDSATLLETNPPFIAAYMAGLNHEMSRELLWREYPSDLRSTSFRRFWAGPAEMPDIHRWAAGDALGAPLSAGSGADSLVLLLRGELLRRYPGTVVYALPAVDRRTPGTPGRFPIFRAELAPDVTCLGFDLSAAAARGGAGKPGWFVVVEQAPGLARFGLDESTATGRDPAALASWNDLAWGDMAATPEALARLTHAPVAGPLLRRRIGGLEWGLNAGHVAGVTLQRPVRVLLHAADLLPP